MNNTIEMRWKAWYGDEKLNLSFPENWNMEVRDMEDAPDIGDEKIKKAFSHPVGTETIAELARDRETAAIVVDDISRPTQASRILPLIMEELRKGGIDEAHTCIIMALGAHRSMMRQDCIKKLGERIVQDIAVYNHCPYENLVDLGRSSRGTPIKINRFFLESDLKIGVGCVAPHGGAGFGGGGKIILPGIAGIETLEANHRCFSIGVDGRSSGGMCVLEGNENRADIEEIAKKAGLDVVVNVVTNSTRDVAGIYVGDLVEAHRNCVELASKVYCTEVSSGVDIGIFNAYPKDTDLVQAPNIFSVYGSLKKEVVREGGTIVVITASTEGKGFHSLHSKGMRLYVPLEENVTYKEIIKNRRIVIFSPNISSFDIQEIYPQDTLLMKNWTEVIRKLKRDYPDRPRVAVFPCASIQLPKTES